MKVKQFNYLMLIVVIGLGGCTKLPRSGGMIENYLPSSPTPVGKTAGTLYIVQAGDTLSAIGTKYNLDYTTIAQWNQIPPPYTIQVGQQIILPSLQENTLKAMEPEAVADDCGVQIVRLQVFNYPCWLFDQCTGADYVVKNTSDKPKLVTIKYQWRSRYWILHKNLKIYSNDTFADTERDLHDDRENWNIFISDCF
jgi:LysM repeat protein